MGGAAALWLVHWTEDKPIHIQALPKAVLCPWTRQFQSLCWINRYLGSKPHERLASLGLKMNAKKILHIIYYQLVEEQTWAFTINYLFTIYCFPAGDEKSEGDERRGNKRCQEKEKSSLGREKGKKRKRKDSKTPKKKQKKEKGDNKREKDKKLKRKKRVEEDKEVQETNIIEEIKERASELNRRKKRRRREKERKKLNKLNNS